MLNPPPVQSPVDQVAGKPNTPQQTNGQQRSTNTQAKSTGLLNTALTSVWLQWFNALYSFLTSKTNDAQFNSIGVGTTPSGTAGDIKTATIEATGAVSAASVSATGAISAASVSATGTVSAASFSGAGTGLTGTATSLNIGGNAATATILQTAHLFNGYSFNGSADVNDLGNHYYNATFGGNYTQNSPGGTGDCNAIYLAGEYNFPISANGPAAMGTNWCFLQVSRHYNSFSGNAYVQQICKDMNAGIGSIWVRNGYPLASSFGCTWQAWHTIYDSVNCPSSLATNGYQKLASGLILQWGITGSLAPGGPYTVTFPVAYPNAGLFATNIPVTLNAIGQCAPIIATLGTTTFTFYNETGITNTFRWFSTGY